MPTNQTDIFKDKEKRLKIFSKVVDMCEEIRMIYSAMMVDSPNEDKDFLEIADKCDEISALIRGECNKNKTATGVTMTFHDDFLRINLKEAGQINVSCKSNGIEWPPPKEIQLQGRKFNRKRYSQISDEDRKEMTHVVRGAEYEEMEVV